MVGARNATHEGMLLAERIAETLSPAGITVVSGLARGIDAAAHKGALAKAGRTVAVLGCGIDRCYPAENWPLSGASRGKGHAHRVWTRREAVAGQKFPQRNRSAGLPQKACLWWRHPEKRLPHHGPV